MPRPRRAAEGDLIYHALNRADTRLAIFQTDEDYAASQRVARGGGGAHVSNGLGGYHLFGQVGTRPKSVVFGEVVLALAQQRFFARIVLTADVFRLKIMPAFGG